MGGDDVTNYTEYNGMQDGYSDIIYTDLWQSNLYTITWEYDFVNKTVNSTLTIAGGESGISSYTLKDETISTIRQSNTFLIKIAHSEAPVTVSSAEIKIWR